MDLIARLSDPELVWRCQQWFGVRKLDAAVSNGTRSKEPGKAELPYATDSALWLRLFTLGSWIGEETFYFAFFPLWFWNFDTDSARFLYFVWALVMWVGQGGKEWMGRPRPASPPVVILERQYIDEYGFPSSHAVVALAVPGMSLAVLRGLCGVSLPLGLLCAAAWASLVCASRVYMGVHTVWEILVGLAEGGLLLLLFFPLVGWAEPLLMDGSLWHFVPLSLLSLGLGWTYPKRDRRWCGAWSDTVGILTANVSLILGCRAGEALGFVHRAEGCLLLAPATSRALWWAGFGGRLVSGYAAFFAVRLLLKALCSVAAQRITGLGKQALKEKQLLGIEFVSKVVVYFGLGWTVAFTAPAIHHLLGIPK